MTKIKLNKLLGFTAPPEGYHTCLVMPRAHRRNPASLTESPVRSPVSPSVGLLCLKFLFSEDEEHNGYCFSWSVEMFLVSQFVLSPGMFLALSPTCSRHEYQMRLLSCTMSPYFMIFGIIFGAEYDVIIYCMLSFSFCKCRFNTLQNSFHKFKSAGLFTDTEKIH